MTSPAEKAKHCPKWIRRNRLPYDECSPELAQDLPPRHRYYRLSASLDTYIPIAGDGDRTMRLGIGTLYRPFGIQAHHFGIGGQADTNFGNEWNAMARLQYSYNLPRHGTYRLSLAGLIGAKHVSEQNRTAEETGEPARVSGNLLNMGIEASLDIRLGLAAKKTPLLSTLSPFFTLHYAPKQQLPLADGSGENIQLSANLDALVGIRIYWDLFDVGGYH